MIVRTVFLLMVLTAFSSCSRHHYHIVKVKKPRYHHGWYKDHVWRKKIRLGRIHIRWFEKQGVKTVKMIG